MRNLVRRYVTQEQRKAENEGVTEDDVNEIKNDISAFRFEMIEIMRASGMNTLSASGPSGPGGKKNRQKERRLMKGFNLASGGGSGTSSGDTVLPIKFSGGVLQTNPEVTIDMSRKNHGLGFARIAKLVSSKNQNNVRREEVNTGEGKEEPAANVKEMEEKRE